MLFSEPCPPGTVRGALILTRTLNVLSAPSSDGGKEAGEAGPGDTARRDRGGLPLRAAARDATSPPRRAVVLLALDSERLSYLAKYLGPSLCV